MPSTYNESLEFKNTNCFLPSHSFPFFGTKWIWLPKFCKEEIQLTLTSYKSTFLVFRHKGHSISFTMTVRANYFQDLLCIYFLIPLESEIITIIKSPFPTYDICNHASNKVFPASSTFLKCWVYHKYNIQAGQYY